MHLKLFLARILQNNIYIYIYIAMETEHAIKEATNYYSVGGKVKD